VYLSLEPQLTDYYQHRLPTFIQEKLVAGVWQHPDGRKLHYRQVVNPDAKCWVVILQGRSECAVKYAEIIEELYQNGCSVFAFDHTGQGQSTRLIANAFHGYIDTFDTYVDDAESIVLDYVATLQETSKQTHLPVHLLCHSMGSTIGTLLVAKRPELFDRVVLCAPMYGILAPAPMFIVKLILSIGIHTHRFLKVPSAYFVGQGDYQDVDFKDNKLTSSPLRYEWFKAYFKDHPDVQLGGVTFQWLDAALRAMQKIVSVAPSIDRPLLVLRAGGDKIVDNRALDQVVPLFPNAKLVNIDNAQHEILFEQDCYRQPAMSHVMTFFELT
jgi:lysophospholipase